MKLPVLKSLTLTASLLAAVPLLLRSGPVPAEPAVAPQTITTPMKDFQKPPADDLKKKLDLLDR